MKRSSLSTIGWAVLLAVVSIMVLAVDFLPEGNQPKPGDGPARSAQKITGLLYAAAPSSLDFFPESTEPKSGDDLRRSLIKINALLYNSLELGGGGLGGGTTTNASLLTTGVVAKAQGGTAADNSSVTFPASGVIPITASAYLGQSSLAFSNVTRLVFDGDSLTSSNLPPAAWAYYFTNQYFATLSGVICSNTALSGQTAWDMLYTRYTNYVQPCKPAGTTNAVLFAWAGINDIYYNTNSPATIETTLSNYWTQAKADGFTVVAFTITDRSDFPATTNEIERSQINLWIRTTPIWDYLVDVAALYPFNSLTPSANSEFTYDGVHFKTNYMRVIADQAFNVIISGQRKIPWNCPDTFAAQFIGTNYFGGGTEASPSIAFNTDKTTGFSLGSSGAIGVASTGSGTAVLFSTLWRLRNTIQLGWASGSPYSQNADVGIIRDTTGVLRVSDGNTGVGVLKTGGVGSIATDAAVTIASTGWTNTFGKNAVVYLDGVGLTFTVYNNAGTAVYTNSTALAGDSLILQTSGKVIITAGTGVNGRAVPF